MPSDAADAAVFDYAIEQERVLLTCNRADFLRLSGERMHPGLVIVIRRRTRIAECAQVLRLLGRASGTGLAGNVNFA
jgi:predicted nuclease of predicted toxin-antitoxin system